MSDNLPDTTADTPRGDPDAPRRLRRRWLLGATGATAALGGAALWAGVLPGAGGGASLPPRGGSHRFTLRPLDGAASQPLNRRVLGSNVQWVDNGDELLDTQGELRPGMLALVRQMAPTTLRYPGGLQSDAYRWERGIGPLAQRQTNEHAHNRVQQPTRMGTLEFLELCEACGAEPLLTVNLHTGSADEAARWVQAVNVTGMRSRRSGQRLPPVRDWELGNEPYLKPDERPDLVLPPAEFARRALAAAKAMRAVDPRIRLGLPVTVDQRRGLPVTAFPGFTKAVLPPLASSVDWLAAHLAYMPFSWRKPPSAEALYWAAMASAATVQTDLQALRTELAALRPGGPPWPLAITEYNALFTLGKGPTDDWIAAPVGALYLADLLRVLALAGIDMAHQWSLSGNWRFGAIHSDGHARPGQQVMALVSEALHGVAWPLRVEVDTVAVEALGLAAAQPALPLLEGLLCDDGTQLRLLLVHKDPARRATGRIELGRFGPAEAVRLSVLSSDDLLATSDVPGLMQRSDSQPAVPAAGQAIDIELPPGSVALLSWRRRRSG